MKCEWCGMAYPDGGWDCYYYVDLFGTERHIICSDCYEHLHKVIYEKEMSRLMDND